MPRPSPAGQGWRARRRASSPPPRPASMISSGLAPFRRGHRVCPLLQEQHWGTWATATAINSLVISGSAPCVERPARGWSGVERLRHRCSLSVAPWPEAKPRMRDSPSSRSAAASGPLPSTAIDNPDPPPLGGEAFPRCPDGQLRQVSDVRGRRLRPDPRHRAAGLDQLLVRSEQCFKNSDEIHPCRTVCPYQQDNDRFFTETAGPDRLLHVDTRLGGRARRTRGGRT
jgi:hypothetical protein